MAEQRSEKKEHDLKAGKVLPTVAAVTSMMTSMEVVTQAGGVS